MSYPAPTSECHLVDTLYHSKIIKSYDIKTFWREVPPGIWDPVLGRE